MSNKTLVNINSKNRIVDSSPTSNFSVAIDASFVQRVSAIRIKNVSFCNCVYNINKYNNKFVYEDSIGVNTILLEPGQYSLNQLLSSLQALLLVQPNPITISFSINSITKKISATVSPNISFFDYNGSLHNILGISLGIVGDSGLVSSLTFQSFPDISGLNVLNIISEKLSSDSGYIKEKKYIDGAPAFQQSYLNGFVYSIPVQSSFGYDEIFENQDINDIIQYKTAKNLSTIDIKCVDTQNRELDLNGTDINIVLEVFYD